MNRASRYWLAFKQAEESLNKVRELHRPVNVFGNVQCAACRNHHGDLLDYPCPTALAAGVEVSYSE